MGIEFKNPGDSGWDSYSGRRGKPNQIQPNNGWGCLILLIGIVLSVLIPIYTDIPFFVLVFYLLLILGVIIFVGYLLGKY